MKYISAFIQALLFGLAIALSFYSLQPSVDSSTSNTDFSAENALLHVKEIAKEPHYTGSKQHAVVRNYIVSELENLDLEPHIQQGFSATYQKGVSVAIPENVIAKIEGKNPESPALVIMSHYDSAPASSFGAADAGSGVATILESTRAFLAKNEQPNQDIIIVFSDTEEVGLNGANLFVTEHPWAKNIGLVLNFEGRGSTGPIPMVLEVNGGNKKLITHFANANIANPFANSLTYSVYKLMPNKTDSTIFREKANVPGFFFAIIDDHFNYHTALDTAENLDTNSLSQQGEYALGLLNYFSTASLSEIASESDHVYFNFPFVGMIHFSTGMVLFLTVFCFLSLFIVTYIGIQKDKIQLISLGKSFLFIIASLFLSFIIGFYGWKLVSNMYPEYRLILHGFPYNGSSYIIAFTGLILALFFRFFHSFSNKIRLMNFLPVAVLSWTIISFLAYLYLPGAGYFVIPAFCGVIIFALLVLFKINNQLLYFLLSLPLVFLIVPFIYYLPVGLGTSSIFISCVLTVLILILISPLLYNSNTLKGFSFLLFCTSLFFFGRAHLNAEFSSSQPRPSSLIYFQDQDTKSSFYASYDSALSNWNSPYFQNEAELNEPLTFESKYANSYNHVGTADYISLPKSEIDVELINQKDTLTTYKLNLKPQRDLNRYELYFDKPISFSNLIVKGKPANFDFKDKVSPKSNRFVNYYVANQEALEIEFTVHTKDALQLKVFESAYNLIEHPQLQVRQRPNTEIPMPFVINDATIVTYTIPLI
jgi:hypothetical protein